MDVGGSHRRPQLGRVNGSGEGEGAAGQPDTPGDGLVGEHEGGPAGPEGLGQRDGNDHPGMQRHLIEHVSLAVASLPPESVGIVDVEVETGVLGQ